MTILIVDDDAGIRQLLLLFLEHKGYTAKTVANMTWLVRGDFDRDLDTMLQMMRDNPSPNQEASIFGALCGVKDLIKTSEDLERFGQFVKRLSEKGFDAKKIFAGEESYGKWQASPVFGSGLGGAGKRRPSA